MTGRRHVDPIRRIGVAPRRAALLLLLASGASACQGTIGGQETAGDQLRRENLALKQQVQDLQGKLELRTKEIEALRAAEEAGGQPVPGAVVPMLVAVEFARYSGVIDTNDDGVDDLVRVYVRTRDQDGRFLPVAGKANLQAVRIEEGQQPRAVAEQDFSAPEWSEAYRTGLMGTHYTLEMPLADTVASGSYQVTVKLTFTEAQSGNVLTTEQAYPVERPTPAD